MDTKSKTNPRNMACQMENILLARSLSVSTTRHSVLFHDYCRFRVWFFRSGWEEVFRSPPPVQLIKAPFPQIFSFLQFSASPLRISAINLEIRNGIGFEKSEMKSKIVNEDEWLLGMELADFSCLPMAMKAAVELDVLQIIANAGNGVQLSPTQIVGHIPTTNPDAAITLDRILRVLASHSVLSCSVTTNENGKAERFYGLTPLCKYLVNNQDGVSLAPLVLMNQDKVLMESWFYLKDAVLEGSQPFTKAHGMNAFEYPAIDQRFNKIFNRAMSENSTMLMNKILDTYEGFKEVQELVDVGGGIGSTLNLIVSRYPHISGINFDLSHVLADAPHYPAVKHVGGDMFDSVPSGQAIFMKWILHDWSDDHCRKLLKNCHKALPEKGKVIAVDTILPVAAETSPYARQGFHTDLLMLAYNPGGKERTEQEFQDLAKETGFAGGVEPVCCVNGMWVMEFRK